MEWTTAALAGAIAALTTPAAAQNTHGWTGGYLGIGMGLDIPGDDPVHDDFDRTFDSATPILGIAEIGGSGSCDSRAVTAPGHCRGHGERLGYAGHVGYDVQVGDVVVGAVGEFGRSNLVDGTAGSNAAPAYPVFARTIDWNAQGRLRAGYAVGDTLPYVTGGVVMARIDHGFETGSAENGFMPDRDRRRAWGYTAGGGIEQRVSDEVTIGALYTYNRVKDGSSATSDAQSAEFDVPPPGGGDRIGWHSVRVRAALRF